jgi:hypothetical protein
MPKIPEEVMKYMRAEGARGGRTAAANMSAAERSARASKAARAAAKSRRAKARAKRAAK